MLNKLLSNSFQLKTKEKTSKQFQQYWQDPVFSKGLEDSPLDLELLTKDFAESNASPIRIYLTQFLINIAFVQDLISEEDEDELFGFWENSDYTGIFFHEFSKQEENILKASSTCLSILERVFQSTWNLNYTKDFSSPCLLKPLPEIGDFSEFIYLDNGCGIDIKKESLSENELNLYLVSNNINQSDSLPYETVIPCGDKIIKLRPGSIRGTKENSFLSDKVSKALNVLKELCPDLFDTFYNFTHTIIALDEPGMVSFSLQSLPGFSSINLYERDFVDCIDDLLHENGHHYLNYILNSQDLIIEDPEKDYFSPWRMAHRPIRGIYHGTFTFYWALELFSQLYLNTNSSKYFNKSELNKIRMRYIEEYHKLIYCISPLKTARENELINDDGWDLINYVLNLVLQHKENVLKATEMCNSKEKDEIKIMLESLEN